MTIPYNYELGSEARKLVPLTKEQPPIGDELVASCDLSISQFNNVIAHIHVQGNLPPYQKKIPCNRENRERSKLNSKPSQENNGREE